MSVPIVALLTDFGTSDPYVGVMKGVILSTCPQAQCVDLTHSVAPQNVQQASYLLRTSYRAFPPHTVFLAVVDPGVGTHRRPLAIHTAHGYFVGPDNGLFSAVLAQTPILEAVVLTTPSNASYTFHGRDVFAPAAAAISNGRPLSALGMPLTDDVQRIDWLHPRVTDSAIRGEVIHIDHFGNVITSIGACHWSPSGALIITVGNHESLTLTLDPSNCYVQLADHTVDQLLTTYGLAATGSPLALISSDGQLEIAVNGSSAARHFNIHLGDSVDLLYRR
jgi:S-adenosylmethionine hydrolase